MLRQARQQAGISQAALARAAGVTPGLLSRYECGRVDPTTAQLDRLLEPLGLEIAVATRRSVDSILSERLGTLIDAYPTLPNPQLDDAGVHDPATGQRLTCHEYDARVAANRERYRQWQAE